MTSIDRIADSDEPPFLTRWVGLPLERRHLAPPWLNALHPGGLDRCADLGHHQVHIAARCELHQTLCRLVPIVNREIEGAPMDGEKASTAEKRERLEGVVRSEVNVAPGRMKRADFEAAIADGQTGG